MIVTTSSGILDKQAMFIDILKLKKVSYSFMFTMSWYLSFSLFTFFRHIQISINLKLVTL